MLAAEKYHTSNFNKNKILIVDDDELVVDSFVKTLGEYKDFIVDKTTNSTHALQLIRDKDYDIVITDIVMPELDGIQLLRRIKKIRPETEVILITAFGSYNSAIDALHFGATDYLSKPFKPEDLKIRILKAIEKRKAVQEKIEKIQEMERMSYTIAHDFKSILISIKAFIKILLEEYSDKIGKDGVFILNRIKSNILDLEKMVEGLLQYSRIGRYNVVWENIDTNSFIEEITQDFLPILKEKQIKFIVDKNLPHVYFYKEGLKHIFHNLIDNAIKYSKNEKDSYIKIGVIEESYDFVKFYIEDNGIGISKDKLPTIFEIFQRESTENGGYGIGLAIVKRILDKANCIITVQSEKGKYTIFYFTLPKAKPEHGG